MRYFYWYCSECNYSSTDFLLPEDETPNGCPRCGWHMNRDNLPRMENGRCYQCSGWGCLACDFTGGC